MLTIEEARNWGGNAKKAKRKVEQINGVKLKN
jgi:hypothetical protein